VRRARERTPVEWLLADLCVELGYCLWGREPACFESLVELGPGAFADAVLRAEGLDPELDRRARQGVRDFVARRFEAWSSRADRVDRSGDERDDG